MAETLEGLTPISLRAAVEALPRRALQSLAKRQGVKANQKSDVLARQLFERFLSEAAQGGGSEDGEAAAPAGASADAAGGGLSPVSEGARYSEDAGEELEDSGAAQRDAPAPSPVPDGLAFNPLFAQGGSDQQEAAAGEAGHPAAQEQPEAQPGSAAAPAGARRVKLLKRERAGRAPADSGGSGGAEGQPRLAGGKRKASVEAPEEAEPPATKRQARKSGGAGPVAEAAAAKPSAKPKPAAPAALKAANGPRRAPPPKPSSAAASQGQAPPAKPASAAPSGSSSVAERARLAEEKHAARRAAALARAGKA